MPFGERTYIHASLDGQKKWGTGELRLFFVLIYAGTDTYTHLSPMSGRYVYNRASADNGKLKRVKTCVRKRMAFNGRGTGHSRPPITPLSGRKISLDCRLRLEKNPSSFRDF